LKYLFVIGSHRTGSKLLANFFNEKCPSTKGVHQYAQLQWNNIFTNMHLTGMMSEVQLFDKLNQKWVQKLQKLDDLNYNLYVESNGFNYFAVSLFLKELNSPYVIHSIRDPRTSIVSHMNWIKGRRKSKIANYLVPFWNLNGSYLNQFKRIEWIRLPFVEKLMYNWAWKNEIISNLYSENPTYLLVRLEDITNPIKAPKVVDEIGELINKQFPKESYKYFNEKQNQSSNEYFPEFSKWDADLQNKLYEICGNQMRNYNYHR